MLNNNNNNNNNINNNNNKKKKKNIQNHKTLCSMTGLFITSING